MLIQIFKSLLLMSAVGGVLSAFLLCVKPITRKLFSPKWQYYIWLTVLIVMVLPVSFSLPKNTSDIPDIMTEQVQNVPAEIEIPANNQNIITEMPTQSEKFSVPKINLPQNIGEYLSALWLFTAVFILFARITKYYLFLRTIRKHSSKYTSLADIPKRLEVRRTDMLDAPLIVGLMKPVLYLPDTELTGGNLNYIIMHELTHYRRHDLLYKWAALIIKSVHWFNPFVYLVSKQIDLDCEVSCDFAVTSSLTQDEQNNYMNMILGLLANSQSNLRPLTTQMASSKKTLKRRFEMIRNKKKTSKFVSVLSAIVAVVMLGTTVFASGVLSGLDSDNYTIEITKNGEKIELINKPFIENGEVYVPLRELFENHLDVDTSRDETYIKWDNGKIEVAREYDSYEPKVIRDYNAQNNTNVDKVTFYSKWSLEIGNPVIYFDKQDPVQMKNAPILRKNVTYIPYIYLDMMLMLDGIGYKVYDKDGNLIYYPYFYHQVIGEYSIKIPDSWSGKYTVNSSDNGISFVQSATYEKYGEGSGTLFRIEKVNADNAAEILNMLGGSRLLYKNDEYAYIFEIPTDVQYPIWVDRDEEDIEIAAEYERMFADIDFIANSFDAHEPTEMISYEPEPEIFADPYSDFLMTNYNHAMTKNNLHGTYDYEYVRHWYNGSNDEVDFYYQIKPFGEDETQYLKMSFEKHGDEWIMYNSDVMKDIPEDAFN